MRVLFWLFWWCLCLGFADIDVTYKDGLHIHFFGHAERRKRKAAGKERAK